MQNLEFNDAQGPPCVTRLTAETELEAGDESCDSLECVQLTARFLPLGCARNAL